MKHNLPKAFKDEKYIYLLMAYKMAKANDGHVCIGEDNGYVDGYHYARWFKIQKYDGRTLLIETKSSKHCADFSRVFEVLNEDGNRPTIKEYWNEANENCSNCWTH